MVSLGQSKQQQKLQNKQKIRSIKLQNIKHLFYLKDLFDRYISLKILNFTNENGKINANSFIVFVHIAK